MYTGIDSQIKQRMDRFRGNPQGLMQQYQQNQELIDLLALQKLKSEKEAAAREMAMQMQQQPQTIKDQREQQVAKLSQDELVQQVGIAAPMQRQKAQQQQVMQAMQGKGGSPDPRQSGIGGLPTPAPKMASGGLVSFVNGGGVPGEAALEPLMAKAKEIADKTGEAVGDVYRRLVAAMKENAPDYQMIAPAKGEARNRPDLPDFLTPAKDAVQEKYEEFKNAPSVAYGIGAILRDLADASTTAPKAAMGAWGALAPKFGESLEGARAATTDMMEGANLPVVDLPDFMSDRGSGAEEQPPAAPAPAQTPTPEENAQATAAEAESPKQEAPAEASAQAATGKAADEPVDFESAIEQATLAMAQTTPEDVAKTMGYTDEESEQMREGMDPRSRAWDRFRRFALGASTGATPLSALTRGTEASMNEQERQRAGIRALMEAQRSTREKAASEAGRQQRQGVASGSSMLNTQKMNELRNQYQLMQLQYGKEEALQRVRADVMESLQMDPDFMKAQERLREATEKRDAEGVAEARAELDAVVNQAMSFLETGSMFGGGSMEGWGDARVVSP